jgi:hypothetical protein
MRIWSENEDREEQYMVSAMRIIAIAAFWSIVIAVMSSPADARAKKDKACEAKIKECVQVCARYNPPSTCRRHCQRGFFCDSGKST